MNYQEFSVVSGLDGKQYDCRFYTLMTAISLRHSDTVDVTFLVNGKRLVISLPHAAFAEYRRRAGRPLSDEVAIQMAALLLKERLEKEGRGDERELAPSIEQTLELAEKVTRVDVIA